MGSLATRDIVARAIDQELKKSGDDCVYLVTEHLDEQEMQNRFPTIAKRLERHGLKLGNDPLPVAPAAHYFVGGLEVDFQCRGKQENSDRILEDEDDHSEWTPPKGCKDKRRKL